MHDIGGIQAKVMLLFTHVLFLLCQHAICENGPLEAMTELISIQQMCPNKVSLFLTK